MTFQDTLYTSQCTVKHSQSRVGGVEVELNVSTQNLSSQAPNLTEKDLVDLKSWAKLQLPGE